MKPLDQTARPFIRLDELPTLEVNGEAYVDVTILDPKARRALYAARAKLRQIGRRADRAVAFARKHRFIRFA